MKRIKNIEQLISDLDTSGIVHIMNVLDFDQKKFDPQITFEQIRDLITERYHRSQKDVFEVEEAVLSVSDLHRVVYTDAIIADIRERVKHWLNPLESIFKYFQYNYSIDYIDESISLDFGNYPDFSRRLGVKEDLLLEYVINSIFFNQFEDKILHLHQLINRENVINKITDSINSK